MNDEKYKILEQNRPEVDDALEKYGDIWSALPVMERELAQKITMLTYYAGGRSKAARIMGVGATTIDNYRSGKTQPRFFELLQLAEAADHDVKYLLSGTDFLQLIESNSVPENNPVVASVESRSAPVVGLASCGPDGWARMDGSRFQATVPLGLQFDPDAFPIITKGQSMQPYGIYEGFLCWCSPAAELKIGDIVCIQRKAKNEDDEPSLTIKMLGVIGHGAYEIIGYRPPVEVPSALPYGKEYQEQFWEIVQKSEIDQISVIAHIITRPEIR